MVLVSLLRPDRYFDRHAPGLRVGRAAAVALLIALVGGAVVLVTQLS